MKTITTPRLIVRPFRETDAADFFAYRSDPAVAALQGYDPFTPEQAATFVTAMQEQPFGQPGTWVQLAIELQQNGRVIGDIGLKPEAFDARIVETGISLHTAWQGQGLAREALTGVLEALFREHHVHRVFGIIDARNTPSLQLYRALGFRQEGFFRKSYWNKGDWRDEYLCALLEAEWHSQHPA